MAYTNRRFVKSAPSSSQYSDYANRISEPTIKDRLEKLLTNTALCQYPKTVEFMRSLLEQYKLRGSLSHKQFECIEENEKRYSDENLAIQNSSIEVWKSQYDAVKRDNITTIANWYKNASEKGDTPYYYRDVCEKILNDKDFVPSQSSYEKIVNNKFAQSYLQQKASINKFKEGDTVVINTAGIKYYYSLRNCKDDVFIVIEVTDIVRPTVGSRLYKVVAIGDDTLTSVEERFLKKYRKAA
jgi:hypothetical protein